MSNTIKLTKPLNDGKITEITVAEPTYGMLQKHGLPFSPTDGIDFKKAGPLLEACTGVQEPFLREMSAKDAMKVLGELGNHLVEDEGNSD
ncbi:MAG: hypothetical protein AAF709_02780 [Pseudomonadota bacterium]